MERNCSIIPRISLIVIALCLAVMTPGCMDSTVREFSDPIPGFLEGIFIKSPCPACSILDSYAWANPASSHLAGAIRHPVHGQTFFVNIDHERKVVSIRPVRERREKIILYDPYHQAASGHETGVIYVQAQCECKPSSNRFELAAGISYPPERSVDFMDEFVLAGKCTICGEIMVLFSN